MNWLDKLERRFGRLGIKGLMKYIVGLNGLIFLLSLLDTTNMYIFRLALIPQYVMQGEVWRLITYLFIPPTFSPIWLIFTLYFYYLIGTSLEHEWGTFKFNLYYLIGMTGTTAAAFITGGVGTAVYLNLSLFLAFAYIFPNFQVVIFFVFPVKIKYLAYLDLAFLLYSMITGNLTTVFIILASLLNFIIFFGKDLYIRLKTGRQVHYRRKSFEVKLPKDYTIHRCEICGKTEKDDKDLEFRYCMDCHGDHEYCMEHLDKHEHVKGVG